MSKKDRSFLNKTKIIKSFVQYLPFSKDHFRKFIFFFPFAVKMFDLKKYDIIISSSHSFAKNITKNRNQIHICYCHTPIRYCHVMMDEYLREYKIRNILLKFILKFFLIILGKWDIKNSKNVDYFVANSSYIKTRIKKFYKRESTIIHPPVDTDNFSLKTNKKDFYLATSRLVPYKKIDLVIKAFNKIKNKKLYVAGSGPQLNNYKKLAKNNVNVIGWVNNKILVELMQNSKALIFPPLEDFGIVPLEAQSCGTPVIAYGKGGSIDTVINFPHRKNTGIFFRKQKVNEIIKSIKIFENNINKFNSKICRSHAKKFTNYLFRKKFKQYLNQCIDINSDKIN